MTTFTYRKPTAIVLSPLGGKIRRKCACGGSLIAGGECEACRKKKTQLQRREHQGNDDLNGNVPQEVYAELGRSGKPLPSDVRDIFSNYFGFDFGGVRIHSSTSAAISAAAISAHAYTVGNHIVFNEGKFNPHSSTGQGLLAHELTHVIQQQGAQARDVQRLPEETNKDLRLLALADEIAALRVSAQQRLKSTSGEEDREKISLAAETETRIRQAALYSGEAEREAILRAFAAVLPSVKHGKHGTEPSPRITSLAKSSLEIGPVDGPAEFEAEQNARAFFAGGPSRVSSLRLDSGVQRFAGAESLIAAGTAILLADAEAAPVEAAAGPPGWIIAGVGLVAGLALVGVGYALLSDDSKEQGGAEPAAKTNPEAETATQTQSTTSAAPADSASNQKRKNSCSKDMPGARICATLPEGYWFPSQQTALAALKAGEGLNSLRIVSNQVASSGPCPGTGMHYGVKDGKRYIASIVCCPCCEDTAAGPAPKTKCKIV